MPIELKASLFRWGFVLIEIEIELELGCIFAELHVIYVEKKNL